MASAPLPDRVSGAPESENVLNIVVKASLDQGFVAALAKTIAVDHQAGVNVVGEGEKDLASGPGAPGAWRRTLLVM